MEGQTNKDIEPQLIDALNENKELAKTLKSYLLQMEFIKLLVIFISILAIIIVVKVIWWS